MSSRLLLLRHAKSSWKSPERADFDRPLNKRGKRDARRMGAWLAQSRLVPDRVISSPARRAERTTTEVCAQLGIDLETIVWEPRVYEASVDVLLDVLADHACDASRVLLVGHNPGLEELATFLCGSRTPTPPDGKLIPTATLVELELPHESSLRQGGATLVGIVRPRALPETPQDS